MNCLVFLVAVGIVYQSVLAISSYGRKHTPGYHDQGPEEFPDIGPDEDLWIHPPWGGPHGRNKPQHMKPKGPFDHDFPQDYRDHDFGPGNDSSEEDLDKSRSRPGYPSGYSGGRHSVTTEKSTITPLPNYLDKLNVIGKMCIRNCRSHTSNEYYPVCGTNKVTYPNRQLLFCEQTCGADVKIKNMGPCSISEEMTGTPPVSQSVCLRSCPVTGEYNPVCGSNNVTYSNRGRLECAQNCGVSVTLVRLNACSASEPPQAITTSTENPKINSTAACMSSCYVSIEFMPICGTNNVTYSSPKHLECARKCGFVVNVHVAKYSACETPNPEEGTNNNGVTTTACPYINSNGGGNSTLGSNGNNKNNSNAENNNNNQTGFDNDRDKKGNSTYNENRDDENNNSSKDNEEDSKEQVKETKARPNKERNNCNAVNKKPPSVAEVMECEQTCTLTSESNPVCGTDSITYMNPGRLLCAQFCGVDVRLKKFAPCNSNSITNVHCLTPCTNPPVPDEHDEVYLFETCLKACPSSMEFKPVCGSNNITYRNLERLQCARRCGRDVNMTRNAPCSAPIEEPNPVTTVEDCLKQCYIPHKYEPLCGSNNITYNNTGHLICVRQCGLDVAVKHFSACTSDPTNVKTTTSSPTTENTPVVTPGSNSTNFTIDPAILFNIWPEHANTTKSSINDEDEDIELDQRLNE